MEKINYSAEIITAIQDGSLRVVDGILKRPVGFAFEPYGLFENVVRDSIKFALPLNGIFFDDHDYNGVQSNGCVEIPYNEVALEFAYDCFTDSKGKNINGKMAIYARDHGRLPGHEYDVTVFTVFGSPSGKWFVIDAASFCKKKVFNVLDGRVVSLRFIRMYDSDKYPCGVYPVLSFINALACKNVYINKCHPRATGRPLKSPFPFDDYHYLTVSAPSCSGNSKSCPSGNHRSPREHIRRGHIRRLDSGPIWVNAAVVNAGIGSKIDKTYCMRTPS